MKKLHLLLAFLTASIVLTAQDNISKKDSTEALVFYPVEVFAEYPGGASEMMKFIHKHLRSPEVFQLSCIQGRVVLRFTVAKTGELSNIRVLRSLHEYLDAEAVRVVKLMPNWIPAKLNGNDVICDYTLPITFKISP